MNPFRQRMLEDMQLRGLAPRTQQSYLLAIVFTGYRPGAGAVNARSDATNWSAADSLTIDSP